MKNTPQRGSRIAHRNKVWLIFGDRPLRHGSLRTAWRMFRRSPKAAVASLVNRLGGQPRHVVCGDGVLLVNPTLMGDRLHDLEAFVLRFPDLHSMVVYPILTPDHRYHPELHCNREPRRNRDAALSVVTMGWWRSRDCTQTACVALSYAGICVPQRITTPKKLRKWLLANTDGEWHGLRANQDDPATQDAAADYGGAADGTGEADAGVRGR